MFVLSLIFGGLVIQSFAQEPDSKKITLMLSEAIERAMSHNPSIEIQKKVVEQAQGLKKTAGVLPNPNVTYYREDLSLNNMDGGEWIVYGGLPLNFLWSRWSKISKASAQIEAQQLFLVDVERHLKYEVSKAYLNVHLADMNYQALHKADSVFDRIINSSRARFEDGDISGYEHQRINIEYVAYKKQVADARLQLNHHRRNLAFFLDPSQPEVIVQTSANFPSQTGEISLENFLALASQNRPDLQAHMANQKSKQLALSVTKWQGFPEVSAFWGYKEQADGLKGAIFQVNFAVPLFDRNQGKIQSARAELNQQILATELLEKQVTMEVKQAYERYQLYRNQLVLFSDGNYQVPDKFLETVLFSYNEGTISLVELIDGTRAYIESFKARNDIILEAQLSIFELEKAAAYSIVKN